MWASLVQAPFAQDGPSWWQAREAINQVGESEQKRGWPRGWRTALVSLDRERDGLANAFLLCRDALIDELDDKDLELTLGHLRGEEQKEIADRIGISSSAASQRQHGHGLYAICRAHEQIRGVVR